MQTTTVTAMAIASPTASAVSSSTLSICLGVSKRSCFSEICFMWESSPLSCNRVLLDIVVAIVKDRMQRNKQLAIFSLESIYRTLLLVEVVVEVIQFLQMDLWILDLGSLPMLPALHHSAK